MECMIEYLIYLERTRAALRNFLEHDLVACWEQNKGLREYTI